MNCPKCNYPEGPRPGDSYKGIYTPGQKCSGCGFIDDEQRPLTKMEYQACQDLLLSLAGQVRLLPLGRFLRAIEKADGIGPLLNPTLWMQGNKPLMVIKKMAEGALAFQNSLPPVCAFCKVAAPAYEGAKYCGAGCSARAEAKEKTA